MELDTVTVQEFRAWWNAFQVPILPVLRRNRKNRRVFFECRVVDSHDEVLEHVRVANSKIRNVFREVQCIHNGPYVSVLGYTPVNMRPVSRSFALTIRASSRFEAAAVMTRCVYRRIRVTPADKFDLWFLSDGCLFGTCLGIQFRKRLDLLVGYQTHSTKSRLELERNREED